VNSKRWKQSFAQILGQTQGRLSNTGQKREKDLIAREKSAGRAYRVSPHHSPPPPPPPKFLHKCRPIEREGHSAKSRVLFFSPPPGIRECIRMSVFEPHRRESSKGLFRTKSLAIVPIFYTQRPQRRSVGPQHNARNYSRRAETTLFRHTPAPRACPRRAPSPGRDFAAIRGKLRARQGQTSKKHDWRNSVLAFFVSVSA